MRGASEIYALDNGSSISRFANRALYLQVRDALAQRIVGGEWKPHAAIPNESELARQFGVSPGTMRKALDLAEAERLLTRRQGRGTFVTDQMSDEHVYRYNKLRRRDGELVDGDIEVLSVLETTVGEHDVKRLRLRLGERIHRFRRVRSTDGKPYMLEDVTMPAKLFPGTATHEDASKHLVALAQQCGVLLGRGEERICISKVAPDVAAALHVEIGTPILRVDRVIFTLQGMPAEWRIGHCVLEDGRYYIAHFR